MALGLKVNCGKPDVTLACPGAEGSCLPESEGLKKQGRVVLQHAA